MSELPKVQEAVAEQLKIVPSRENRVVAATPMRRRRKMASAARAESSGGPQAKDGERQEVCLTEEEMLERLGVGASYCQDVERQLAKYVTPELDTIMKLHRVIILKLSTQAEAKPELWDVLKDLMKPVMDWARLQEQQKEHDFAERKYRDQVEAEKTAGKTAEQTNAEAALTPETLERIELELKLL